MYEFSNQTQQYTEADRTAALKTLAGEKLSRVAVFMAAVSVILSRTIFVSLVLAGISVMLAVISSRENPRPQGRALIAMGLAALAVIVSVYTIVSTVTQVLIPALTDPVFRQELNTFYMDTYGLNFDEVMQPLLQLFGNGN